MLDKLTHECLRKISIEIKKSENQQLIHNEIISPMMKNISNKVYPWINLLLFMYSVMLILIISILVLILFNRKTI